MPAGAWLAAAVAAGMAEEGSRRGCWAHAGCLGALALPPLPSPRQLGVVGCGALGGVCAPAKHMAHSTGAANVALHWPGGGLEYHTYSGQQQSFSV
jgi:hypothetical protein